MDDLEIETTPEPRAQKRRKHRKANDVQALVFDPGDPFEIARRLIADQHTDNEIRLLHFHDGRFWRWNGTHYDETILADIRAEIYSALSAAVVHGNNGLASFKPNAAKVSNVVDAYRAVANLRSTITSPDWIERIPQMPPASELLPCANGFLHVRKRVLYPVSPLLFTQHALPYSYDPDASEPQRWFHFLHEIWADDKEPIDTLQEIFGYALTRDTSQQKIFLLVGPKRSGKGTIARVLTDLIGRENVVNPTLASLATNFGQAPLIGKQLAVIADARLGNRSDPQVIAERLLSISGEDGLTLDRKYLPPWTGQLAARFLILTNEIPRLADSSGALASRFVVLTMYQSFYGREDPSLIDKLLPERAGILNWAIDGLERLKARGNFLQPQSSRDSVQELEHLGSPIMAFIRDNCREDARESVETTQLYRAFREWCDINGYDHPGTIQTFGRDLRAALPGLRSAQRRDYGKPKRYYQGLRLL